MQPVQLRGIDPLPHIPLRLSSGIPVLYFLHVPHQRRGVCGFKGAEPAPVLQRIHAGSLILVETKLHRNADTRVGQRKTCLNSPRMVTRLKSPVTSSVELPTHAVLVIYGIM